MPKNHPEDLKRGHYAFILGPRDKPADPNPVDPFGLSNGFTRITTPTLPPGVPFLIQASQYPFLYVSPVDLHRNVQLLMAAGILMVDLRVSRVQRINPRTFFLPRRRNRVTPVILPSAPVASTSAEPDGARRVSWPRTT